MYEREKNDNIKQELVRFNVRIFCVDIKRKSYQDKVFFYRRKVTKCALIQI